MSKVDCRDAPLMMCENCKTRPAGFTLRPRSKYCSVDCGLENAERELRESEDKDLDALIEALRNGSRTACASDRDDIRELDAAQTDILQIKRAIEHIKNETEALETHLQHIKGQQVVVLEEGGARKVVQIDCPTCGNLFASSEFTSHIESCYQRIDKVRSDAKRPKKTPSLTPQSAKSKTKEQWPRAFCGCPIDGCDDAKFCRQQHNCEKHEGWEEITQSKLNAKEQQLHASQQRLVMREARIRLRLCCRHKSGPI